MIVNGLSAVDQSTYPFDKLRQLGLWHQHILNNFFNNFCPSIRLYQAESICWLILTIVPQTCGGMPATMPVVWPDSAPVGPTSSPQEMSPKVSFNEEPGSLVGPTATPQATSPKTKKLDRCWNGWRKQGRTCDHLKLLFQNSNIFDDFLESRKNESSEVVLFVALQHCSDGCQAKILPLFFQNLETYKELMRGLEYLAFRTVFSCHHHQNSILHHLLCCLLLSASFTTLSFF